MDQIYKTIKTDPYYPTFIKFGCDENEFLCILNDVKPNTESPFQNIATYIGFSKTFIPRVFKVSNYIFPTITSMDIRGNISQPIAALKLHEISAAEFLKSENYYFNEDNMPDYFKNAYAEIKEKTKYINWDL